ncbi:MAG: hypothetical protein COT36_02035 [Parcubacteria group bacterium CG08_land_8_20_14_0_20_38_56]|nr:MAG: hypothetical protein COT36_02035 [Parcubacteria group bacterium CG08_land_8_20_14_0_20_38_56]
MNREELRVPVEKLRWVCNTDDFEFNDTSEVQPLKEFIGQERAIRAFKLGLEIGIPGYNIFATGFTGTGRNAVIYEELKKFAEEKKAQGEIFLKDLCYIYNVDEPSRPNILIFEKGKGRKLQKQMKGALEALKKRIPATFQSEEYLKEKNKITDEFEQKDKELFGRLFKKAEEGHIVLLQTQGGLLPKPIALRQAEDGKSQPMSKEEYESLDEETKRIMDNNMKKIVRLMGKTLLDGKRLQEETDKKIKNLEEKWVKELFESVFKVFSKDYQPGQQDDENGEENPGYPEVLNYFEGLKGFVLENVNLFKPQENNQGQPIMMMIMGQPMQTRDGHNPFLPFEVNVFVDNSKVDSPPIIVENHPTFPNLFGKIEKKFLQGAYLTDHTMVKAGSLCLADGGYLVVNAIDLLRNPGVWYKLEKTLKRGSLKIEDSLEYLGYVPANLNPKPIPINVKVIVIGEPDIYHLLVDYDEEFLTVFRVKVEFDSKTGLNAEQLKNYAGFISFCCQKEELLPFAPGAVAKVVEYGVRLTDNQKKLSTQFGKIKNLLVESNYWAKKAQSEIVAAGHVQKAIEAKKQRVNLLEEKIQEAIIEQTLLVDTEGEKVGQINGLAVYDQGDYMFGKPFRITARTFVGKAGVVSIDKEAKLSGPIYHKAILILSGYFGGKYAQDKPLSFSASICSEQSYGLIEGDSASIADLVPIISELSGLPVNQSFAVTGSMNQKGEVQPIGGVNQKIEGFFDICNGRGLNGKQGVIIPEKNVKNLMLREDVVEAVAQGRFCVYAVKTVDEAIELLLDHSAEDAHLKVNERLREMNEISKEYRDGR